MNIHFHDVTKIELVETFLDNSNSRKMRVTWLDAHGAECNAEFVCYGKTSDLEGLPRSDDFRAVSKNFAEAAE